MRTLFFALAMEAHRVFARHDFRQDAFRLDLRQHVAVARVEFRRLSAIVFQILPRLKRNWKHDLPTTDRNRRIHKRLRNLRQRLDRTQQTFHRVAFFDAAAPDVEAQRPRIVELPTIQCIAAESERPRLLLILLRARRQQFHITPPCEINFHKVMLAVDAMCLANRSEIQRLAFSVALDPQSEALMLA